MVVGRLTSFREENFSGAILNFGLYTVYSQTPPICYLMLGMSSLRRRGEPQISSDLRQDSMEAGDVKTSLERLLGTQDPGDGGHLGFFHRMWQDVPVFQPKFPLFSPIIFRDLTVNWTSFS